MPKGGIPRDPVERLWSRVDKDGPTQPHMDTPCWLWTGATSYGYGQMLVGSHTTKTRRYVRCPRLAYEAAIGPLPNGLLVLHRCDLRRCVRPDHLFLGTHADNTADMLAKGRSVKPRWTKDQIRNIRLHYGARGVGGLTYTELADVYGVGAQTIKMIVTRKTYRHVE